MKIRPTVCGLLPPDARDALIAASQLPNQRDRQLAIQEATERAQRKYPEFYQTIKGATK